MRDLGQLTGPSTTVQSGGERSRVQATSVKRKAGAAKKGWRDTRQVDMRAKLHNKRTGLRRHDLTTTDLDRQTQSSTIATGLEVRPDHRHRASEVSRASKTNSWAAEPVCHTMTSKLKLTYDID